MLAATLLALAAAVLHAAWNLAVKQQGDRFTALWGQFACAGLIAATVLAVVTVTGAAGIGDGPRLGAQGWIWAAASGAVHLPYCWFLARAYDHGDFSLVYPMARGTGALLAASGGVVLLGDDLSPGAVGAIAIIGTGLVMLSGRERTSTEVRAALAVALTIGAYSVIDAHGIRVTGSSWYVMASFIGTASSTTGFSLATGRWPVMAEAMRSTWRRYLLLGSASMLTYGMVQLAFQRAPVGYVTAIRESSVVIAAFAGSRMLGEAAGRRRIIASTVVVAGLVALVLAR